MDDYQSLSHTRGECKYHVVFILRVSVHREHPFRNIVNTDFGIVNTQNGIVNSHFGIVNT